MAEKFKQFFTAKDPVMEHSLQFQLKLENAFALCKEDQRLLLNKYTFFYVKIN